MSVVERTRPKEGGAQILLVKRPETVRWILEKRCPPFPDALDFCALFCETSPRLRTRGKNYIGFYGG